MFLTVLATCPCLQVRLGVVGPSVLKEEQGPYQLTPCPLPQTEAFPLFSNVLGQTVVQMFPIDHEYLLSFLRVLAIR